MPATLSTPPHHELLEIFSGFIRQKGITLMEGVVPDNSFLPGILIHQGTLVIDKKQLRYPGDLLHEAGHIAVTPAADRHRLSGNVTEDGPGKPGDEMAVLLWTYAACLELGLPPETIFHEDGYKGDSQWLIGNFSQGVYIGLPLLVWMGMAHGTEHPHGFPAMVKWLRD